MIDYQIDVEYTYTSCNKGSDSHTTINIITAPLWRAHLDSYKLRYTSTQYILRCENKHCIVFIFTCVPLVKENIDSYSPV